MRTVVVLPGHAPVWVEHHARHLAWRLAEQGRVLVAFAGRHDVARMLPGEMGKGSVLGNAADGYPMWTGGLAAAVGLRRRRDATVVVLWSGANGVVAVLAGLAARVRGERLVVDLEHVDRPAAASRRVAERALVALASGVVRLDGGDADPGSERVVLAACGGDFGFARTVCAAFDALAAASVSSWRLHLVVEPGALDGEGVAGLPFVGEVRHADRITVDTGPPAAALDADAAVVLVPHDGPHGLLVDLALTRGCAGVVVGHPVGGRVVRRGDGAWLATDDPSAILVAMESSTGAVFDSPVSPARLRLAGNAVVATVTELAAGPAPEPVPAAAGPLGPPRLAGSAP